MRRLRVIIGYEPREADGYAVTAISALRRNPLLAVQPITLEACREAGLYTRPTVTRNGRLFDVISDAPMSTEFALTRFLVPWLVQKDPAAKDGDWVLFLDCDTLIRCDLNELLEELDESYAVMCVQHNVDHGSSPKIDGCEQLSYKRKNWSSVMAWNLNHDGIKALRLDDVNSCTGLNLHQLEWLYEKEIGALSSKWNHLVGVQEPNADAKIVHFTQGLPSMPGYEHSEHADEWRFIDRIVQEKH